MDIYKLSQKIPNNNPAKEIILLAKLWEEAQRLRQEVTSIVESNDLGGE